jgi:hypothetical protein
LNERKGEIMEYRIYVDMDGTLTDFEKAFLSIDGRSTKEIEKSGDDAFWSHVDKGGLSFWADMPWINGSKDLWNKIKNLNPKILSSPARRLPNSKIGKLIWVKRELGNVPILFKRAREKYVYAKPNSILIDDLQKNIDAWNKAGGIGIKFESAKGVIKKLKDLGIVS